MHPQRVIDYVCKLLKRKRDKLTPKEISKLTGVSISTIRDIQNGKRQPIGKLQRTKETPMDHCTKHGPLVGNLRAFCVACSAEKAKAAGIRVNNDATSDDLRFSPEVVKRLEWMRLQREINEEGPEDTIDQVTYDLWVDQDPGTDNNI